MFKHKSLFLALPFLLAGCSSEPLPDISGSDEPAPSATTRFVHMDQVDQAREFLVRFSSTDAPTVERFTRSASSRQGASRTGLSRFDAFLDTSGALSVERVFPVGRFEKRMQESGLSRWYKVRLKDQVTSAYLKQQLSALSEVEVVEMLTPVCLADPHESVSALPAPLSASSEPASATPSMGGMNDPYAFYQWHYYNDGTLGENAVAGSDINLPKAWERTMGDPAVIVGVVDEYVQYNHPDLKDNMWVNQAEANGQPGVDDDCNGYIDDIHGFNFSGNTPDSGFGHHGTHVAGTIAAVNNNGIGVCGIAGGSGQGDGVRIMACGTLDPTSSYSDIYTVARAAVYATDNGACILQNSWGYIYPFSDIDGVFDTYKVTPIELEAYRYFIRYAGYDADGNVVGPIAGGVVIFSAGNSGSEFGNRLVYPAACPDFIAVSAVGWNYLPAYYTGYGPWIDMSAPGGDLRFDGKEGGILSTCFGDTPDDYNFVYYQGTSMACPHVSGVAALVASYARSKHYTLTSAQMKDILLSSGRNIESYFKGDKISSPTATSLPLLLHMSDYKGMMGNGLIDASLALDRVDQLLALPSGHAAPAPVTQAKAVGTNQAGTISVGWTLTTDCQFQPLQSYAIYYSPSPIQVDQGQIVFDNYIEGPVIVPVSPGSQPGQPMVHMLQGLLNDHEYHIALVGYDQWRVPSAPVLLQATTRQVKPLWPVAHFHVARRTSHSITLQWEEVFDAENRPYESYQVTCYPVDDSGYAEQWCTTLKEEGAIHTLTFDDLSFFNDYVFTLTAYDRSTMPSKDFTIQSAPVTKLRPSDPDKLDNVQYWVTDSIEFLVLDTDYSTLTAELFEQEGWSLRAGGDDTYILKFAGPVSPAATGNVHLKIYLTDSKLGKLQGDFEFNVIPNVQPELTAPLPDQYFEADRQELQLPLDRYFHDANHEPLTYTVSVSGQSVSAQIRDANRLVLARQQSGPSEVTVRATDHGGLYLESTFRVMSRQQSAPMELYPNPVRDVLHIRFGQEVSGDIQVTVRDHNGHIVRQTAAAVSPYAPASINMQGIHRGTLQVEVTCQGQTYKGTIIKM